MSRSPVTRSHPVAPVRNAHQLEALPARSQKTRQVALSVVARARRDNSTIARALRAIRAEGHSVSRAGVLKYAGPAIERGKGGRLVPTASDRIYRRVPFLTDEGAELVDVRSSRRATLVGKYRNALRAYVEGDDPNGERVRRFEGKSVGGRRFQTDLDAIDRSAIRRELDELSQEGS